MNNEVLARAKELNTDIDKLKGAIGNISYHHRHVDKKKNWKPYDWMIRICNSKPRDDTEEIKPKMFLFDNDDIHGSDIPIDEELLIVIKSYFENKLKEKEQQFNELI